MMERLAAPGRRRLAGCAVTVTATWLASACAGPAPQSAGEATAVAQDTALISREMDAAYARFTEGYRTAHAATVANLYTEDAFYLQPGSDVLRGRPAVLAAFESFLGPFRERGEAGPEITFEFLERRIADDIGYDIGYYLFAGQRAGKFTVVWRRGADGVWRIHSDGYSDLPTAGDN
jgi:ketosteroid isomerase-like protein